MARCAEITTRTRDSSLSSIATSSRLPSLKLKRVTFEERDQMKKLTDPVMAAYAKEIGAEGIFSQVNGV